MLSSILKGEALVYPSGLAAVNGYLCEVRPKRVAITGGYHGVWDVLEFHKKLRGIEIVGLDETDKLEKGDVIHLETPVNPAGEARNIATYAQLARERGAWLVVDATLGPPALQDPFAFGADIVIHSATKFIGGHSDMMSGVTAVAPRHPELAHELFEGRRVLGAVPGILETWLGLRSVRTLELRTKQQSKTATELVAWISEELSSGLESDVSKVVSTVHHPSLQKEDMEWLKKQMPGGFGSIFQIVMKSEDYARRLPSKLRVYQHATSLGGVESLIEWRMMTDNLAAGDIIRISIGIESVEDLKKDLLNGFKALLE